jgi:membrane protein DedA with SNARE-associated domain
MDSNRKRKLLANISTVLLIVVIGTYLVLDFSGSFEGKYKSYKNTVDILILVVIAINLVATSIYRRNLKKNGK